MRRPHGFRCGFFCIGTIMPAVTEFRSENCLIFDIFFKYPDTIILCFVLKRVQNTSTI